MAIQVEAYSPYIENLLHSEPWRAGPPHGEEVCPGAFDWDGSAYWCCHACGRIGSSPVPLHYPVVHPWFVLQERLRSFIAAFLGATTRRASQAA